MEREKKQRLEMALSNHLLCTLSVCVLIPPQHFLPFSECVCTVYTHTRTKCSRAVCCFVLFCNKHKADDKKGSWGQRITHTHTHRRAKTLFHSTVECASRLVAKIYGILYCHVTGMGIQWDYFRLMLVLPLHSRCCRCYCYC